MPPSSDNATLARLEDQINWYDRKSLSYQRIYKSAKTLEIAVAAFIPLGSALNLAYPIIGGLGVVITLIEGLLHLNQYQQNWLSYRTTCEALKREKYLFLASAGPYANAANSLALLADRSESLTSQENTKWIVTQSASAKDHEK